MDRVEARDYIYSLVSSEWHDMTVDILGQPADIRYAGTIDKTKPAVPDNGLYWCRVSMQIVVEGQETLRQETRRYQTTGLVFVQLFCPVVDNKALTNLDLLSERMRNAFRADRSDKIEFTRSQINDSIAAEANWLRANVVSTFQYRQFV